MVAHSLYFLRNKLPKGGNMNQHDINIKQAVNAVIAMISSGQIDSSDEGLLRDKIYFFYNLFFEAEMSILEKGMFNS